MIGTHQQQFRFTCPYCFAKPGKPCHEKGNVDKTCETHSQRKGKARRVTSGRKQTVIWTNAVETNPRRH